MGEGRERAGEEQKEEREEEEHVMADNVRLCHRLSGDYRYPSPPLIYTVLSSNEIIKHNENLKVCFFPRKMPIETAPHFLCGLP